ncbi:MAG: nucleotidyltransferase substrate binding protein [Roseiarcus sp.]|jgi:nucleotidyltransferase substrate binding protein (TIGR01987 family)
MLKAFLEEEHNAICTSPRTCFKAAFKNALIGDDPFWIDMTKLRNYTVHTYNESLAEYVYARLPACVRGFASRWRRRVKQESEGGLSGR